MKQVEAEKYNIAWFKLAECIARREKERALGVYRLLSHSFDNDALVHQLQGDILLAFDETELALEQYVNAAALYEQQEQPAQAVAVYDHIITLKPDDETAIKKMIELYERLQDHARMSASIKRLCMHMITQRMFLQLFEYIKQLQLAIGQKAALLMDLCLFALPDTTLDQQAKYQLVQHTLDRMMHETDHLQSFLKKLEQLDELCYTYACEYIKQSD